jgi:hypothetical protein
MSEAAGESILIAWLAIAFVAAPVAPDTGGDILPSIKA